jgi:hypothetical protein
MVQKSKGVRYKQPSSVNFVSFLLLALLLGAGYWAFCFGPAYFKNYQVKQLVHEAASRYYKLSFLDKSLRAQKTNELMNETRGKIVEVLGFNDPQLVVQLLINEESKKVNVVAEYDHTVALAGTQKVRVLHFKTLAESDYKPNDW